MRGARVLPRRLSPTASLGTDLKEHVRAHPFVLSLFVIPPTFGKKKTDLQRLPARHTRASMDKGSVSGESESIADKYFVCTECLVEGNVQSFVDLFYLTHALDTSSGYGGDEEDSGAALTSFETLQFLKHKLTEAEVANRTAQRDTVFEAYEDIAKHFQTQQDYKTAVYFLTKALSVAQQAHNPVQEAHANEALGLAKEKMGAIPQAIEYYETHRDLLVRHGLEVPGESARHVIRAYKALAEELQRQGDYHAAIGHLEKSLEAARALDDRVAEGVSLKLLGNAFVHVQQHGQAIEYFHQFLRICQDTDDKMSEGTACSALASAYEASGDRANSIKFLELFYENALTTGELTAQREACARLGIIFNSASNYQDSVHHFSKAFEISRSLGDPKAVDTGRVNLGVARGSANRAQYLKIVNTNLNALLAWKNRRTPLDDAP